MTTSEVQLITTDDGVAIIGRTSDVDLFLASKDLDHLPSKELKLQRLLSFMGAGGAALQIGSDFAENSGRWVKLTAESADAVKEFGLMATKTPGVSHAMIGNPGDIQRWIQIAKGPSVLLAGPMMLPALATMMSQQAMQRQMDDIAEYLEVIDEKVNDILRAQKDAVLADMIGVDLVIEETLTVRDHVGRVSDISWSKVQANAMTIARTQAYALRQLDAIAEKLERASDLGSIAKATGEAEPKIREWLAVLARCFQLQDGMTILELDRVLDAAPDDLDDHRLGLYAARQNRLDLIATNTARLLTRMHETAQMANARVLLNPFDAPAAVRSSNHVTTSVLDFRGRLGIESGHESTDAKRWGQALGEARDKAVAAGVSGAAAAKRVGEVTLDRTTEAFRAVDIDGDGIPDKPRAMAAAEEAGSAFKGAAKGVAGAFGTLFQRKSAAPADDVSEDRSDGESIAG